jgi:hypothetical protein
MTSGTALVVGVLLMLLGVALVVAAVFRALRRVWALGPSELWWFLAAGFGLILLGRWLVP